MFSCKSGAGHKCRFKNSTEKEKGGEIKAQGDFSGTEMRQGWEGPGQQGMWPRIWAALMMVLGWGAEHPSLGTTFPCSLIQNRNPTLQTLIFCFTGGFLAPEASRTRQSFPSGLSHPELPSVHGTQNHPDLHSDSSFPKSLSFENSGKYLLFSLFSIFFFSFFFFCFHGHNLILHFNQLAASFLLDNSRARM